jgi:hypothetical protein
METAQIPRHPDDIDLTWERVHDALAALEGLRVAVRVVERSDPEMLLAAFQGNLGAVDHAKPPALFWPVRLSEDAGVHFEHDRSHQEAFGFYLHPDRFHGAVGRAGSTVLAVTQGPVVINIRAS